MNKMYSENFLTFIRNIYNKLKVEKYLKNLIEKYFENDFLRDFKFLFN